MSSSIAQISSQLVGIGEFSLPFVREFATIQVGEVSGVAGECVDVPVNLTETSAGVCAYGLRIRYDSAALQFVGVQSDRDLFLPLSLAEGSLVFMWTDCSGGRQARHSGDRLFTMKFRIHQHIACGNKALIVDDRLNPGRLAFTDQAGYEMSKSLLSGKVTIVASARNWARSNDSDPENRPKWLDTGIAKAATGVFY
ncbi:MAG: hypothetical protein K0R75_469 [Paenibacillaceae bacterium]|jgi:hypothetical protein|nr:hypothetical protein [Paenibacillaceae bacterium]